MKGLISVVLVSILTGCASAPPPAPFDWQKEFAGYWADHRKGGRDYAMVFRYPYMWEFISNKSCTFRVYASELRYMGSEGKKIIFAMRNLGNIDEDGHQTDDALQESKAIDFIYMYILDDVVIKAVTYDFCDTSDSDSISVDFFDKPYPELMSKYKKTNCVANDAVSSGAAYTYVLSRGELWESEMLQIIAPDLLPPDN